MTPGDHVTLPLPSHRRGAAPILITGGSGFIGSNLADSFLADGEDVIVLDNLSRPGVAENLRWLEDRHGSRVHALQADVRDPVDLEAPAREAKAVFHLAAQTAVTTSLEDPMMDFEVNARGTINVLESIRRSGKKTPLVFASTNKVYGALTDLQMEEGQDRYEPTDALIRRHGVSEERKLSFCTPYGCSKGVADQYALDYAASFAIPTAVMRMSCIYGPRQFGTEDQGWVAHFLISILSGEPVVVYGNGKQVRDVLHVRDAVAAYRKALAGIDAIAGSVFNLGGGPENAVSLKLVLDEIAAITGIKPRIDGGDWRKGDQLYFVADTREIERRLGWKAEIGWREGLRDLAEWLSRRPVRTAAPEPRRATA